MICFLACSPSHPSCSFCACSLASYHCLLAGWLPVITFLLACLPSCFLSLLACLFARLLVSYHCGLACLLACLLASYRYLLARLLGCWFPIIAVLLACLPACPPACLLACLLALCPFRPSQVEQGGSGKYTGKIRPFPFSSMSPSSFSPMVRDVHWFS